MAEIDYQSYILQRRPMHADNALPRHARARSYWERKPCVK